MSRNSDVAKTELQLQNPGSLVVMFGSSTKILGIKYEINYSIPTLHIVSIQNGAKVT